MILLGIDSSTDSLSVGLADGERILGEKLLESRREHASHIIDVIDEVFVTVSRSKEDLGGIGVAIGPGSFTGLRIGMAVAKGLAMSLNIPIIGISTFEVIAGRLRDRFEKFYLAARARKGELYLCWITPEANIRESFSLVEEGKLTDLIGNAPIGFIGDIPWECSKTIETQISSDELYVSGGELAVHAAKQLSEGNSDSLSDLEPLYIAPSQAERKFGRK